MIVKIAAGEWKGGEMPRKGKILLGGFVGLGAPPAVFSYCDNMDCETGYETGWHVSVGPDEWQKYEGPMPDKWVEVKGWAELLPLFGRPRSPADVDEKYLRRGSDDEYQNQNSP